MAKRKIRTVPSSAYLSYLAKAEQFVSTMEKALDAREWDSVGLQAVHAVISTSDALTVYYGGVRSSAEDHRAVAELLQDILGAKAAGTLRHVTSVLAKKNQVEYEQRLLTEKDARELADHARRLLSRAKKMLPSSQ